MNPSAAGWLKKLLKLVEKSEIKNTSTLKLYQELKSVGFIYGNSVTTISEVIRNSDYTLEECCKINYSLALLSTYNLIKNNDDSFETKLKSFYTHIGFYKPNFIANIIGESIENTISKRIQTETNIFLKTINPFTTNAFLFIDILAFEIFLKTPKKTKSIIVRLEDYIRSIISEAFNSKLIKSKYDESLIKLLESSLRLSKQVNESFESITTNKFSKIERLYLLDIVCIATWSDSKIDSRNQKFINQFRTKFNFSESEIMLAFKSVNDFYICHKNEIPLLSTQNLAKRFYEQSVIVVKKLIARNSKRIYQELKESKELVKLLSESTFRDLNKEEQNQMQEQMMDLLKSIPSLAIFMLPGGAILLPLFIKFIPKLLPSAFDENRIENN